MPGPLLVATIKETYHRGALAGPLVAAGHGLIESIMVVALAFGLARFVSSDLVMGVVGSAGGLALIFLGYGMVRDVVRHGVSLSQVQGGRSSSRFGPMLVGVIASAVNPYWITWWLTIGATYVLLSLRHGMIGLPVFYIGHVLSDFTWLAFVSVTLARGRRLIGERLYLGLILICGLFLWVLALWFIYSGIRAFTPRI